MFCLFIEDIESKRPKYRIQESPGWAGGLGAGFPPFCCYLFEAQLGSLVSVGISTSSSPSLLIYLLEYAKQNIVPKGKGRKKPYSEK